MSITFFFQGKIREFIFQRRDGLAAVVGQDKDKIVFIFRRDIRGLAVIGVVRVRDVLVEEFDGNALHVFGDDEFLLIGRQGVEIGCDFNQAFVNW